MLSDFFCRCFAEWVKGVHDPTAKRYSWNGYRYVDAVMNNVWRLQGGVVVAGMNLISACSPNLQGVLLQVRPRTLLAAPCYHVSSPSTHRGHTAAVAALCLHILPVIVAPAEPAAAGLGLL